MPRPDQIGDFATIESRENHDARPTPENVRPGVTPEIARDDGALAATHWTRILHVDLLNGHDDHDATGAGDNAATDDQSGDARRADPAPRSNVRGALVLSQSPALDTGRRHSSVPGGAILLAFCMVLYLAILGTEHLVSPSAGAALEEAARSAYDAVDSGAGPGVGQWPQGAAFDDDTEQPIGGRGCMSRPATASVSLSD